MEKKQKTQEVLGQLLGRIETAEQWRDSNFRDLWKEYYLRYRSRPLHKREGSNIFVPYTFMNCNVINGRIAESLFANRPCVTVLPRGNTAEESAEKTQSLLDWQLYERIRLPRLFADTVVLDMIVYGTAITYTGWKKETKTRKRRAVSRIPLLDAQGIPQMDSTTGEPITVPEGTYVQETKETVYDDPIVQNIDLFCFFVDPQASSLETARFCGHKEYRTRADLEKLAEENGYAIDWKTLRPAEDIANGTRARYEEMGLSSQEEANFGNGEKNALYEVLHYWEPNRHVVILGRNQLALDEENPFWHGEFPYDRACYLYLPQEFYGMGVVELTAGLQDELNTTRNQRIDYNSMALRRMWKARKGSGLTPKDLVWRQNGVIQVENMDDVQEIAVQPLPASAFANEDRIKQDMKDATGCHDIILGLSETNETATTTMTKDNNASIRFKRVVEAVCEDMLVPIAKKIIALDQQFMTEEKMVRIVGDLDQPTEMQMAAVSPFEIEGEYDLIYVGTAIDPMANKELNKTRLTEAVQLMFGDELYQKDRKARLNVFRRIYENMEQKDVENLLPNLEKIEAEEEQARMLQQQIALQQMQSAAPQQNSVGLGGISG